MEKQHVVLTSTLFLLIFLTYFYQNCGEPNVSHIKSKKINTKAKNNAQNSSENTDGNNDAIQNQDAADKPMPISTSIELSPCTEDKCQSQDSKYPLQIAKEGKDTGVNIWLFSKLYMEIIPSPIKYFRSFICAGEDLAVDTTPPKSILEKVCPEKDLFSIISFCYEKNDKTCLDPIQLGGEHKFSDKNFPLLSVLVYGCDKENKVTQHRWSYVPHVSTGWLDYKGDNQSGRLSIQKNSGTPGKYFEGQISITGIKPFKTSVDYNVDFDAKLRAPLFNMQTTQLTGCDRLSNELELTSKWQGKDVFMTGLLYDYCYELFPDYCNKITLTASRKASKVEKGTCEINSIGSRKGVQVIFSQNDKTDDEKFYADKRYLKVDELDPSQKDIEIVNEFEDWLKVKPNGYCQSLKKD